MKAVKASPQAKAEWSKGWRQFTSKIGQITDSESEIIRIVYISIDRRISYIHNNVPRTEVNYTKSYIHQGPRLFPSQSFKLCPLPFPDLSCLQAETEVTAEKKGAKPLAQVTSNLLDTIEEVFFSKLVQRIGGWPIPIVVPPRDMDSKPWENDVAWKKAMGYRYKSGDKGQDEVESSAGRSYYTVSGFHRPHIVRFGLMCSGVVGLEVLGSHARNLWGRQWKNCS